MWVSRLGHDRSARKIRRQWQRASAGTMLVRSAQPIADVERSNHFQHLYRSETDALQNAPFLGEWRKLSHVLVQCKAPSERGILREQECRCSVRGCLPSDGDGHVSCRGKDLSKNESMTFSSLSSTGGREHHGQANDHLTRRNWSPSRASKENRRIRSRSLPWWQHAFNRSHWRSTKSQSLQRRLARRISCSGKLTERLSAYSRPRTSKERLQWAGRIQIVI